MSTATKVHHSHSQTNQPANAVPLPSSHQLVRRCVWNKKKSFTIFAFCAIPNTVLTVAVHGQLTCPTRTSSHRKTVIIRFRPDVVARPYNSNFTYYTKLSSAHCTRNTNNLHTLAFVIIILLC